MLREKEEQLKKGCKRQQRQLTEHKEILKFKTSVANNSCKQRKPRRKLPLLLN